MTDRASLPNRRYAERIKFSCGNHTIYGTLGYRDPYDPLPSEVFLQAGKSGTDLEASCRDAAVAVSLALQHGTPFEVLRNAMTRLDDSSAAGIAGRLLDLIASSAQATAVTCSTCSESEPQEVRP